MKLSPIEQHPRYKAAAAEINELTAALSKVRGRLQEIEILAAASPSPDRASANLAAALEFAASGLVKSAPGLVEERGILSDQERALVVAIDTRRQEQAALVSECSAALTRDLEPRHKALAKQYLALLQEIDAIAEQEVQWVNEIERAGYGVHLRERLVWRLIGRIDDSDGSALQTRARELRAYIG